MNVAFCDACRAALFARVTSGRHHRQPCRNLLQVPTIKWQSDSRRRLGRCPERVETGRAACGGVPKRPPGLLVGPSGGNSRMALFKYLHDDAFLVFSRGHRRLYAACLLDLLDRFFSGSPSFPTPQQVVHAIYDVMRANPSLWSENDDFGDLPEVISAGRRRIRRADTTRSSEPGDKAMGIARQLYWRLLAWEWLEEEEYGLRVTV